ncbi:MAG: hypothetical protein MJ142_04785 [Clostridia bacterium]|nr:hypothetical protein [Clostridia bacterium]
MSGKTVLINCSPKKKMSVSGFLMKCLGLMIGGEKIYAGMRVPSDRAKILEALRDAGKVVFVMPLYVDSVPSHVLPLLMEMEKMCLESGLDLKVYVLANNGFIEGRQNEPLMCLMENFCNRAGITWCGGVGIGGGVMLNVMRILVCVQVGLTLLSTVSNIAQGAGLLEPVRSLGFSLLEILVLCCGILTYTVRLARHVKHGTDAGKRYTRIMLPSFIFILLADIFFAVTSLFQGGLFRGWLSRIKPDEKCGIIGAEDQ